MFLTVSLFLLPALASAQTIETFIGKFQNIIRLLIPVAFALALLWFLFGVAKYVTQGGDEEKRKEARNTMIYGIIALFVMSAVWGLVGVLTDTTGLRNNTPPPAPEIPR